MRVLLGRRTWVRVCEEGREREEDFVERERGRPVGLEGVDTDASTFGDVHVVYPVFACCVCTWNKARKSTNMPHRTCNEGCVSSVRMCMDGRKAVSD